MNKIKTEKRYNLALRLTRHFLAYPTEQFFAGELQIICNSKKSATYRALSKLELHGIVRKLKNTWILNPSATNNLHINRKQMNRLKVKLTANKGAEK